MGGWMEVVGYGKMEWDEMEWSETWGEMVVTRREREGGRERERERGRITHTTHIPV